MDRPKRSFPALKTPKKDEHSQDQVSTKKSFKDKANLLENAPDSEDGNDGGKFRNIIFYILTYIHLDDCDQLSNISLALKMYFSNSAY